MGTYLKKLKSHLVTADEVLRYPTSISYQSSFLREVLCFYKFIIERAS